MIHTDRGRKKFRKLMRLLRPLAPEGVFGLEACAVGLIECLIHAVCKDAPRGDIGAHLDNEDIADQVSWYGDADELVRALVQSGWLAESEEHRLVFVDWHNYAPQFVKGVVARQGLGGFVTASGQPGEEDSADSEPDSQDNLSSDPKGAYLSSDPKGATLSSDPTKLNKPNPKKDYVRTLDVRPFCGEDQDGITLDAELYGTLRPTLKRIQSALGGLNPNDKDKKSAIVSTLIAERLLGHDWLAGILDSCKANRPASPWRYFHGAVVKSVESHGGDYHALARLVHIPPEYLEKAPPPQLAATA